MLKIATTNVEHDRILQENMFCTKFQSQCCNWTETKNKEKVNIKDAN